MLDVIVNQCFFCVGKRALDRLQLLGDFQATAFFLEHRDDALEVAFGTFEALDDVGVRCVRVHLSISYAGGEDTRVPDMPITIGPVCRAASTGRMGGMWRAWGGHG